MRKIRIGIVGYGNLGKSAEIAIRQNKDMELVGIYTRRDPQSIGTLQERVKAYSLEDAVKQKNQIDVMILCGGSMADLTQQGPYFAGMFNTVDGFDTHAKIPEYFNEMDKSAKESKKIAIISGGWDPGMFSLNRLYGDVILPEGKEYTFWGKGISQGHSDAVRRVEGVVDAKQYTVPSEGAIKAVRSGETPDYTTREKHYRECFVVASPGADKVEIERTIRRMPNYFAEYDTIVHFITQEELDQNHGGMPHGGFVIRSGRTGTDKENKQVIEYNLKLDSNPDFTAHVLVAYARAAYRMNQEGFTGAKTVFDIAPAYLSEKSSEELRGSML